MHFDFFQTLADPTRRRIVEMLRMGERSVNDIAESMDVDQSGVSRHLRVLHQAGFVEVRRQGPWRFYSLRREPFDELEGWLTVYRRAWDARLERFGAALRTRQDAKERRKR